MAPGPLPAGTRTLGLGLGLGLAPGGWRAPAPGPRWLAWGQVPAPGNQMILFPSHPASTLKCLTDPFLFLKAFFKNSLALSEGCLNNTCTITLAI